MFEVCTAGRQIDIAGGPFQKRAWREEVGAAKDSHKPIADSDYRVAAYGIYIEWSRKNGRNHKALIQEAFLQHLASGPPSCPPPLEQSLVLAERELALLE